MTNKPLLLRPKLLQGCSEPVYIASGSTCDVYRVSRGGEELALKVISCGADFAAYGRAMNEIAMHRKAAGWPNLVRLTETETEFRGTESYVFLLLEYLTPLEKRFTSAPMTVEDVIKLGMDLCSALQQCAVAGMVHLDVQPKNVFLGSDGRWKLGDFGSAVTLEELPRCKDLRGTPSYMAPEVWRQQAYSRQADIYALGILLYSLLNGGNLPFGREGTKAAAIRRRLDGQHLPALAVAGQALSRCILKACSVEPGQRPGTPDAFRKQLSQAMENTGREILRSVVNPWTEQLRPAPPAPKAGKPSFLGKLFRKAKTEVPAARPAPVQPRECQMFTSDTGITPAPQIFESDGFASTCAMASPPPQIFESDGFASTCAMAAPSPQIFESDGFASTCAMEAPPTPGYTWAPPPPAPAPAPAPGYSQQYYVPQGYPQQPYAPQGYPAQQQGYGAPPVSPGYPNYPTAPGYPAYPGYGAPAAPRMDQVRFSALAPKSVEREEWFETRIFMYQETFRQAVDEAIAQAEAPVQEKASGFHKVRDGAQVKIILSSPDVEVEDNENCQVWTGGYLAFDFAVYLPEDYAKKQVMLKAAVYFDGVPATRLMLTVKVQAQQNAPVAVQRQDILSAFVSYASQDRGRVASLIQGMTKARPDLDVFFDVSSLTSGQRWEERLYKEIDSRDILFLCWSHNARNSPWVEREWRYALQTKGVDAIEPIPLEQPDLCPPPQELSSKHFNDTLLYIINR